MPNETAKFGFFDLDATFSAAFVFVLVEAMGPGDRRDLNLARITTALGLLEYLSGHGNKAAGKRQADIEQMCRHLRVSLSQSSNGLATSSADGQRTIPAAEGSINAEEVSTTPNETLEPLTFYTDTDFNLTGAVETDWEEFERMIFRLQN